MTELTLLNLMSQHEVILKDLKIVKYLSEYTMVNTKPLVHQLTILSNSMREKIDAFCTQIKVGES